MKAVVWTKYGSPDGLVLREVEKPTPKAGEVLIRVRAATVTMGDCELRSLVRFHPKGATRFRHNGATLKC